MGAHTNGEYHKIGRCLVGANALAPDLMSAEERLTELAQLLAAGLFRLLRQQPSETRLIEKNGVDFSPERSVHATARQRRQVRR